MEIFSFVCNEALTLTSLLKHTTMDVQCTITFGRGSTINPVVYWYWHKQICTNCPHYWPVISLIKSAVTPQDGVLLRMVKSATPHSPSLRALHNNNTAGLFLRCSFWSRPNEVKEGGKMKLLVSSRRRRCLRHWFTLGSEPQYLIIAMGI